MKEFATRVKSFFFGEGTKSKIEGVGQYQRIKGLLWMVTYGRVSKLNEQLQATIELYQGL